MRIPRNGKSVAGTFLLIGVAIVAFSAIDRSLARTERVESDREAMRLFLEGQRLQRSGDYTRAIDSFRTALVIDGEREEFVIALAEALLQSGRSKEAESALNGVLQLHSVNAEANLMMARVLVKQNDIALAESYYHRAIYDQWPNDAARHRLQARLELIDLLARNSRKKELLSELLALQSEAGSDMGILKRIAPLYLTAGSPQHASETFRDILRSEPRDADAYAGLGQAELLEGQYRKAEGNFGSALRINPQDEESQRRLELCRRVMQLDPTRRGLSLSDRYRRSLEILTAAVDDLRECSGATASDEVQQLVAMAQQQISNPMSASHEDDAIEGNLDFSERLWSTRLRECKQPKTSAEQPLELVLEKISQ